MANETLYNNLISATLAVTSSAAFLFYAFVWTVIVVYYKTFKNRFYLYIIAAGFSDIGMLLTIGLYCVPCIFLQKHIYNSPKSIGVLYNFLNQSQVAYMFYAAVNRCYFCLSTTYSRYQIRWGSKRKTLWLLFFQFTTAFFVAAIHQSSTPGWRFAYGKYTWSEHACKAADGQLWFCLFGHYLNWTTFIGLPCVAGFLYIVMWVVLVRRRRQNAVAPQQQQQQNSNYVSVALRLAKKREMRLLVQFTFITAVSVVDIMANLAVSVSAADLYENAFIQLLDVLNAVTNPMAYLLWDRQIRGATKRTCRKGVGFLKKKMCKVHESVEQ